MDRPSEILSDIIVHSKYARWWGELGRRETFEEVVARNFKMAQDQVDAIASVRTYSSDDKAAIDQALKWAYSMVHRRKVLPSMRALQFGGDPIFRDPHRIYNCAYMHANDEAFFRELMFLLLGGSGVGYSVQEHHVRQLPSIAKGLRHRKRQRYLIQDSVIGWSNAVDALMSAYFNGTPLPRFDYSEIRPEGTILKTSGGKAPGPRPLKRALERIEDVLKDRLAVDVFLRPIDVHDIACHIADAVLSGGIRRSAMIALFSPTDQEMLQCKAGVWWEKNAQRGRANNSAVLVRGEDEDHFHTVFDAVQASGSGDPGFFWTYDRDIGTNPCAEISLNNMQFCNLTTINVGNVENQNDLNLRAQAAAIIGTVQATFTDFHYLRPGWKETTEKESLVGVSMTGIASGRVGELDLAEAADIAVETNQKWARELGIRPAARVTTVKPEGTASLVLGTSSGIHAWHDDYYIRRIRFHENEAIAQYLVERFGVSDFDPDAEIPAIVERDNFSPETLVFSVPQRAPYGAKTRHEGAVQLLKRVARFNREWVRAGHQSGDNLNNVSTTVNVSPTEWKQVREWMFNRRHEYTGIAILPYDGGTHVQAPFETITREQYEAMAELFGDFDITEVDETEDYTNLAGEAACAGGACEVVFA